MGFEEYRGNRDVVEALRGMVARNRLPHALIFAGAEGVGKYTLALMLAKAVHCVENARSQATGQATVCPIDFCGVCANCRALDTVADRRAAVAKAEEDRAAVSKRPREIPLVIQPHPDVTILPPNGPLRLFQIEQARHLKQSLEFVATGRARRIFILPEADRMDAAAANSLLKSLEEPPADTVLILTTSSEASLLPTIRSRCVPLWFSPVSADEISTLLESKGVGANEKERKWRAAVTGGSPGAALRLDRERYLAQRDALLSLLAAGASGGNFTELINQAQKLSGKEESLENLVEILYILFQDILHIESKANGEPLRNTDRPKTLMQVAHALGLDGLRKAAANLGAIERNLRRNVPTRLSLEALALDLAGSNQS
jgi:DNA polymerase III subunit delta'